MGDFVTYPVCRVCYVNMYMEGIVLVTFFVWEKNVTRVGWLPIT